MAPSILQFFLEETYSFFLMYVTPVFYALIFISVGFLFVLNVKSLCKNFAGVSKKTYVILFLIFLVALWLRLPRLYKPHEALASVWEYTLGGKFLALKGALQRCDYGSFNDCPYPSVVAHPAGLSFMLAVIFSLFGVNMEYLKYLQFSIGALTTIPLFFLSYILTKDKEASLLSSTFLAIFPLHVTYTIMTDGVLSVVSVFFTTLYFTFLVNALKKRTKESYALAALSYVLLLSLRMEYLMYIPISLLFYFHFRGFSKETLQRLKLGLLENRPIVVASFLLAIAPLSVFLNHWIFGGLVPSFFSLSNIPESMIIFSNNARMFFAPLIFVFAAYMPVLLYSKIHRRISAILLAWFIAPIALFSLFTYGPTGRYTMPTSIPLALVLGLGTSHIGRKFGNARYPILFALPFILFLLVEPFPSAMLEERNIDELLVAIRAAEKDSMIIIPDKNTIWGLQCFDSDIFLLDLAKFFSLENKDKVYFLYTRRCESEVFTAYREHCEYFASIGTKVFEGNHSKLFFIGRLTPEQTQDLMEIYKRCEPFL